MRDSLRGIEVLMVHRSGERGAFRGFWVFPGGRIDPEDHVIDRDGTLNELATGTAAAVREAKEEVDLDLSVEHLVALSHWMPPPMEEKRFSTWFFLAACHTGAITIDGGEIRDHEWIAPSAALKRFEAGEIQLAPPTMITLQQVSDHASVEDALAVRRAIVDNQAIPKFHTRAIRSETGMTLVWPGDVAYDSLDLDAEGPKNRAELSKQSFRWITG